MKRPSRGERWSATTTRQIGFFLPPTRVRRTRTDIGRKRLATAGELLQIRHPALGDLLHELLHLAELLHEMRNRLHRGPRPARDAPTPGAVDDRRVGPLLGR